MMLCVTGFAVGCVRSRTVFVEPGAPIRIGPDAVGYIYHLDDAGEWTLSSGRVTIPEGWYCVAPEDGIDGGEAQ